MTGSNKDELRKKLLEFKHNFYYWEIWAAVVSDYGVTDPSYLICIAEGEYKRVVDYALGQPGFVQENYYTEGLLHCGKIVPIRVPVVLVR